MSTTPDQRKQWREVTAAAPDRITQRLGYGDETASEQFYREAREVIIPALLDDVVTLEAERDAWKQEFEDTAATKARLCTELYEARAERDALRAEVERLHEKVSDMRSERVRADEKHKEEVERFKARPNWTNLRAEIEKLKAALTEACDIASAHLTALSSVFGGKADKIESAVARIAELRKAGGK